MKTQNIAIIIAGLLVAGAVYFSNTKEEMIYLPQEDFNYEEEVKTNFMEGCVDEGNKEICECSWNKLMQEYGIDEFVKIATEYTKTDRMPKKMEDIAYSCI